MLGNRKEMETMESTKIDERKLGFDARNVTEVAWKGFLHMACTRIVTCLNFQGHISEHSMLITRHHLFIFTNLTVKTYKL